MAAPSEETQKRALKRVLEERTFVRKLTSAMRDKWLRWYEITRLFKLRASSTYNRVFLPLGWQQIEKIAPRITTHDPVYELIPTKNSAIPFTEIVGGWLMFMWEEKDLRRQARLMVKNGLTYGTGFVKLEMDQVTKTEVVERTVVEEEEVFDPMTGELETQETEEIVEEEIELSNLPIFYTVDIFDIDVDPRVERLEDAAAVIHSQDNVRIADLEADAGALNYFNLDKLRVMAGEVPAMDTNSKLDKLNTRGIPATMESSTDASELKDDKEKPDLNALVVREYWGRFSPDGKPSNEKEYVITIVNDAKVIRLEENPYITDDNPMGLRPFELFVDSDQPNELYGVGEIEPTETLQIGVNKVRNQRLDNVDFVMNRMWIYDRAMGINPRDLISRPGHVIGSDDIEGLKAVETPDVTSSAFAEEDRYLRDFQMATGTIDAAGGGGRDDFINTATGQKHRAKEQDARYGLKIENLESTLSRIGLKMLQMINSLGDDVFVIRRKDEEGQFKFTEIDREVLFKALDGMTVKVKAGSTFSDDSEERRNDAIARWNMAIAAFNAGVIAKEQLSETYRDMERLAFRQSGLIKQAKTPPEEQLNPAQTQISPETLAPNGVQPGIPVQPVAAPNPGQGPLGQANPIF